MTTDATVSLPYDHLEYHAPFLMFSLNAPFSQGGLLMAVVHKSLTVTRTPKVTFRDENGNRLLRIAAGQDINLRELRTGELQTPVVVNVYGPDGEPLIDPMQFKHNFDLRFRNARRIEIPTTPSPTPPPTKPPVLDTWRVTHPDGMNIRSTPQVTADNSNLVGSVPTGWLFENDDSGATSTNYLWNYIYSGEHNGKNFAGNWIAVEKRSTGYRFCKLDLGLEPPATGTVQLTGDIQLVKRPDGYTRLTNVPPVGFNLRGAIHYTKPEWQDLTLDWMQAHGFNWVRTYVARADVSLSGCLNRTGVFVDKCKSRGIHVCLVVTDSLRDSGHIIDEMIPWHNGPQGHITYPFFAERQYTKDYFNWVDAIATEFGQDVSMIDLCNEPALYPQAGGHLTITQELTDAYVDCFSEAARIAYSASGGNVPITVGWINANHFRPANKDGLQHARETAKRMKYMQAYSFHVYAEPVEINPSYHPDARFRFEEDVHNMDFIAARETGKALLVGEYGSYESNAGRAQSIRNFRTRNPEAEIMWYWQVCPLVQGQDKDIVINTGDCDGHALVLGRDGEGEFWDCVEAAKA